MGIFDGCLLACDIDGTLIFDKVLPERNIEKIEYFVREGGAFSLSTGRTYEALIDVTSRISCISPSVCSNGCVIYDFKEKRALKEVILPKSSLKMVKKVIDTLKIGVEIQTADGIYVPSRSAASDLHEEYESLKARFTSFENSPQDTVNKVLYFVEDEQQYDVLLEIAKDYSGDCVFYKTSAFIGGVKQNYLEQIPFGVSKASALCELCGMLNIKKGGYFAIGDYYNDVEMLKAADISAAPGESPSDVKDTATVVVGKAKNGAVADFIEYLEENLKNGQADKVKS